MEVLPKRLKKCRANLKKFMPDCTQAFVADKIGVARTTYTAYENGTKLPPIDTLLSIAQLFNVSIDYLIGRTNEERPYIEILQEINSVRDVNKQLSFLKETIQNANNYTFDGEPLTKVESIAIIEIIDLSLHLIKKIRQC